MLPGGLRSGGFGVEVVDLDGAVPGISDLDRKYCGLPEKIGRTGCGASEPRIQRL